MAIIVCETDRQTDGIPNAQVKMKKNYGCKNEYPSLKFRRHRYTVVDLSNLNGFKGLSHKEQLI